MRSFLISITAILASVSAIHAGILDPSMTIASSPRSSSANASAPMQGPPPAEPGYHYVGTVQHEGVWCWYYEEDNGPYYYYIPVTSI